MDKGDVDVEDARERVGREELEREEREALEEGGEARRPPHARQLREGVQHLEVAEHDLAYRAGGAQLAQQLGEQRPERPTRRGEATPLPRRFHAASTPSSPIAPGTRRRC